MRILVVQESDWFERGPLQQNHLMEKLSQKGHEIRVIDHEILWPEKEKQEIISKREVFEDSSRIYEGSSVTVIRPPILKISHLDYISLVFSRKKEIERQVKEFKPDVIVGFFMLNAYLGMKAAKKHDLPFIYYWIDIYHSQIPFKLYRPTGKMIEGKVLRNSNAVIAINERLREKVIELGSNPSSTYVERAGLDFNRFNFEISGSNIRKEHGIGENDVVIGFVGVLYDFSGLKEIAEGFGKIKDKYPHIKLLFVGYGDASMELEKIKRKYGMDNNLILTGRQPYDKIPEFISAFDICILPAHKIEIMMDIVPIKMYEYMAMEKPVITTKLPGVMKEFGDNNGVLYVNEPEDVLKKAIELIDSNSISSEGKKARRFVSDNDWDKIVDHFENIVENLK
ncbi:MAG: glycosyltransferase [Methanobacterium sp.]|uniref:glycosyltransferase n=1 Tax=Methanobacterium sp. TaxID=2164 RepID=UPI003D660C77|nr:glycosyltransferase [Methanobacterium sp.]